MSVAGTSSNVKKGDRFSHLRKGDLKKLAHAAILKSAATAEKAMKAKGAWRFVPPHHEAAEEGGVASGSDGSAWHEKSDHEHLSYYLYLYDV